MTTTNIGVSDRTHYRSTRINRLATSEKVFEKAKASRLRQPYIVTGVTTLTEVSVIAPSEFHRLNVCEDYQRVRINTEVNDLIMVLRAGGQILDPIDVAERPDGTWWILDGQQRFWAHSECGHSIRAQIHRVTSLDQEKLLFTVLNSRVRVTSDGLIHASAGQAAAFIKRINSDSSSPFYGLVSFGGNMNSRRPFSATTLMKALFCLLNDAVAGGKIEHIMMRVDGQISTTEGSFLAKRFLDLLSLVTNLQIWTRNKQLYILGLARVARKRWRTGTVSMPSTGVCRGLKAFNVDAFAPSQAVRFLPSVEAELEKRWKA